VPPQTGFACLGFAYAGIARRLEKCWGKTGVPVFLFVCYSLFDFGVRGSDCGLDAESGRPQLSKSLICDSVRSVPRWRYLIFEFERSCYFWDIHKIMRSIYYKSIWWVLKNMLIILKK